MRWYQSVDRKIKTSSEKERNEAATRNHFFHFRPKRLVSDGQWLLSICRIAVVLNSHVMRTTRHCCSREVVRRRRRHRSPSFVDAIVAVVIVMPWRCCCPFLTLSLFSLRFVDTGENTIVEASFLLHAVSATNQLLHVLFSRVCCVNGMNIKVKGLFGHAGLGFQTSLGYAHHLIRKLLVLDSRTLLAWFVKACLESHW